MTVISIYSLEEKKIMKDEPKTNTSNELLSNVNFDNLNDKIKPELGGSGDIHKINSGESKIANGISDIPIVADLPNLYNKNGNCMQNLGYFIIPRSVTSDPRYKSARLKYKHILHILFEKVAFSPTTHAVGTHIIKIQIGQICISEDHLAELCNEGVKYEEDKITGSLIHRSIKFWSLCGFVNQQVNHKKNVLTITVPEFYERLKSTTEPHIEPRPNHDRTTKEEYKELKEHKLSSEKEASFEPSSFAAALLSEFYFSLFSSIPDFPKQSAKRTKTQYLAADAIAIKAGNDLELIRKVIAYAHQPGGFWLAHVHSMSYLNKKFTTLVQQLRDQGKKPMNGKKPQPKYNHDTRPPNPNNSVSFAEEV